MTRHLLPHSPRVVNRACVTNERDLCTVRRRIFRGLHRCRTLMKHLVLSFDSTKCFIKAFESTSYPVREGKHAPQQGPGSARVEPNWTPHKEWWCLSSFVFCCSPATILWLILPFWFTAIFIGCVLECLRNSSAGAVSYHLSAGVHTETESSHCNYSRRRSLR